MKFQFNFPSTSSNTFASKKRSASTAGFTNQDYESEGEEELALSGTLGTADK